MPREFSPAATQQFRSPGASPVARERLLRARVHRLAGEGAAAESEAGASQRVM